MLHAPVLAHLGDRHAGTVFTRCHSVVGRPGGAMPPHICMQVPFIAWSPDIRHHTKRQYKPRPRLPEEHAEPAEGPGGDQPAGTGGGRAPSEAGSVRSEGSQRSRRSGGSEASTARGHVAREVVVPQPSRDELGDAHNDPPLDRVTLAARQPDPAWTQQVPPGPDGRQRHLSAVWDMELESRGVQGTLRISFPCPIVLRGGSNLPAGQELVGMFAYRLVSGHWRVQTGVSRIGEAGTVTTAGICGLNVLTGWEQRRPEWVDVAWLAMRVHVGRQRKMGVVVDVIDVEEDEPPPPTRKRKGRPEGDTGPNPPPPPQSPAYGHPGGAGSAGGAGGAGGGAGAEGDGAGVGGPAAGGGVGGTRHQRGGRQPRPRGPSVQGPRGQAGLRVAVGGRHQGA